MPIEVTHEAVNTVTLTFTDPYTFEEWTAALTPLLIAGPELRLLVDRSRSTAPTKDFVDRMVGFFQQHADKVKDWRAAVVTGSDVGYGVARMLEMTAEARQVPMRIRTFRSEDEARRWLTTR
jgi:hypothetical protein